MPNDKCCGAGSRQIKLCGSGSGLAPSVAPPSYTSCQIFFLILKSKLALRVFLYTFFTTVGTPPNQRFVFYTQSIFLAPFRRL
jgi:hypothetical protein